MSPRTPLLALFLGATALGAAPACSNSEGALHSTARLAATLEGVNPSAPKNRLPLSFDQTQTLSFTVTAQRWDGSVDASFNGFIRITSKPGLVTSVSGPGTSGRNVKLEAGVAQHVSVSVVGAYGDARIWFEDMGYTPADPARTPPPQCSDGIDNNGDGHIDFPADPGCAYANDDTEEPGTYTAAVSEPVYFILPRIADVRGVTQGGTATSFPHEQVDIDTGYRQESLGFEFSTVVTRITADGFHITDLADPRGFSSLFAFTFSAPPNMRPCDRFRSLAGTSSDFFGFTELGFPTWQLEEWDPTTRPCMVPEPYTFTTTDLLSDSLKRNKESSLVRVPREPDPANPADKGYRLHIPSHFGPDFPAKPDFLPTENASNCDLNGDSKIDYTAGGLEAACSDACAHDPECTEFSNYLTQHNFNLIVTNLNDNTSATIQADGSASPQFDPLHLRGQAIRSFTGTLRYFSGGSQFTMIAGCKDDIIEDLKASPVPSDRACVNARTQADLSAGSN